MALDMPIYVTYRVNDDRMPEQVIMEGNISCHARGQQAFVDSYLTCFLYQLPFVLETIGFSYICMPLIFAIIAISIFGKIQENYRWFILNQAIWDFLVIYDFLCEKHKK